VAMGNFGEINVKTHNFPPHKVKRPGIPGGSDS